jgi:hypothetical protein
MNVRQSGVELAPACAVVCGHVDTAAFINGIRPKNNALKIADHLTLDLDDDILANAGEEILRIHHKTLDIGVRQPRVHTIQISLLLVDKKTTSLVPANPAENPFVFESEVLSPLARLAHGRQPF